MESIMLSAAQRRSIDELAGDADVAIEDTNLAGTIAVTVLDASGREQDQRLIGLGGAISGKLFEPLRRS